MENEESQTMQIGEIAEKTGLSLRTLRHYDEIGLLRASDRSEGGFRLYTNRDLQRLLMIRRMKPLGFSLEEMNELLGVIDQLQACRDAETPNIRERLAAFVRETEQRREKLVLQLEMADEFLDLLNSQ